MPVRLGWVLALLLLGAVAACSQDNYEVQVYGSETIPKGVTMFETHSNFTIQGSKTTDDKTHPTNHQFHETIEITHGFNDWFEMGFYLFTSAQRGTGWEWVGDHIRPRVRAPDSWHWPVGVSLSTELGYVRPSYSADTWTWEIRPIVDKQIGKFYAAFNPTLGRSFHGPGVARGVEFSPNVKVSYSVWKRAALGLEYYGTMGPVRGFDAFSEQSQQFIPTVDLDLGEQWEFNLGMGVGVTHNTDHLLLKLIVGRRFGKKRS